jgi:AbrB family looped-hinge helix DNA binding protein
MNKVYEAIIESDGITIPEEIRERHGITAGTRVRVIERGNEFVIIPIENESTGDIKPNDSSHSA